MDAYAFQAALICDDCARAIIAKLPASANDCDDSDHYPAGPYGNGGGEADCPQHCDCCNVFLENPLTRDGRAYVQDAVDAGTGACVSDWAQFYDVTA